MAQLPTALRIGPSGPRQNPRRRESDPDRNDSYYSSSSSSPYYNVGAGTPLSAASPGPGNYVRSPSGISEPSWPAIAEVPNEPPRRYTPRPQPESGGGGSVGGSANISPARGYEQDDYFVVSPVSVAWSPATGRQGSMVSVPSYSSLSSAAVGQEPMAWDPLAPQRSQSPVGMPGAFDPRGRQHNMDSSGAGGTNISRKWGSVRRNTLGGNNSGYGPLEDVDEEGEAIPIDISEFSGGGLTMNTNAGHDIGLGVGGGIEMQSMRERGPPMSPTMSKMVPGVGQGMQTILSGHTRGRSLADADVRDAVQKEVQKQDQIIAFAVPGVDLTGLDGSEFAKRNATTTSLQSPDKQKPDVQFGGDEVSYMFPKDPKAGRWSPFAMKWPYMLLLILLALAIGGIQEYLCQVSIRKQQANSGLLVFSDPKDIATIDYFAWKYLPTIVLVTYGVMWQAVDYDVKRLEAFHQLSKPDGALARDSLNLDYLTMMSYIVPVVAIRSGQWAVVLSSVATLVAGTLIPVLQAASVNVSPPNPTANEEKHVNVNPLWSRIMTGLMGLIAILGVILLFFLRRKSGLLSDPKGIAGIASMATKSHILSDFEGMDTTSIEDIHSALEKRRYRLYKSSLWQGRFLTTAEKNAIAPNKLKQRMGKTFSKMVDNVLENPLPIMLQKKASIPFTVYLLILAALLPLFLFLPSANSFIVRTTWLLTLLATVAKVLWSVLDISVRVVEPLYILSQREAPAKTLTLDYTALIPGLTTFRALRNGHHVVALVSTGAILTEVLTVCVTSLGVDGNKFVAGQGGNGADPSDRTNSSDTFRSFWISFGLAMFVIFYLLVVGAFVASRRHKRFLPRQPGSISSVLALIYSSNMLMDFVDTEHKNSKEMTTHLEEIGKKYGLGWFNAKRDNRDHCGVDEEPLLDFYTHGKDWTKTRLMDNVGGWETFDGAM